jgi:hypothetical protein
MLRAVADQAIGTLPDLAAVWSTIRTHLGDG